MGKVAVIRPNISAINEVKEEYPVEVSLLSELAMTEGSSGAEKFENENTSRVLGTKWKCGKGI